MAWLFNFMTEVSNLTLMVKMICGGLVCFLDQGSFDFDDFSPLFAFGFMWSLYDMTWIL
jgi:hypothetical protein